MDIALWAVSEHVTHRHLSSLEKIPIAADSAPENSSMSYVERFNWSTFGLSNKLRNHAAAVALYMRHYNSCRIHESLRTTPIVALGVTDGLLMERG